MKSTLLISLLFLIVNPVFSQQQRIDSLLNAINNPEVNKKEKLDLYKQICIYYESSDVEQLKFYAETALKLAEKEKDYLMRATFTSFKGRIEKMAGNFDAALLYFDQALDFAIKANHTGQQAVIYNDMANVYNTQSRYTLALEYFMKALTILDELDQKVATLVVMSNIGGIYRSMQNNERAIYYLEKAELMANELDLPTAKLKPYYDLAYIHLHQEDVEKALDYALKGYDISIMTGNKMFEILTSQALADIYGVKEEYEKAIQYAKRSVEISEEFVDHSPSLGGWSALSNAYFKQKRYKESELAALKVWEMDSTNQSLIPRMTHNIVKSNIYLGEPDKAADFVDRFISIMTKYSNKNFQESLSEMEIRYETEKKELRIAALEEEKKLYTWLSMAGITILLLILGLIIIKFRMNRQKRLLAEQERELAQQQVKQLEQEKQVIAIQSVLEGETSERTRLSQDLHDGLGGMLSVTKLNIANITSYPAMDESDIGRFQKALKILDDSIIELRRVAHHMMPRSLMVYGLKVSIEDFCKAIPEAQFYFYGNESQLDNHLKVLLYRCIYELVNNALKHANATDIKIQLIVESHLISLTIFDNGTGFNPESVVSGNGLENIQKRVAAYNGMMNINSSENGTEINIEIELS